MAGDTIYNMLKVEDCEVDGDDRPLFPPKIKGTEVRYFIRISDHLNLQCVATHFVKPSNPLLIVLWVVCERNLLIVCFARCGDKKVAGTLNERGKEIRGK